ncbi:Rv3235 family protein [Curtobacterium oceanosedimentum]|uniref:Rv3235 family protein n=1 Tax=Curtobacterium oceanosedimentum TaxID=465820 RepID=UPI001CE13D49|nr:Rv3235 family protein [Curtobacterium oceanosedimentum]MCA5924138.1 Rv3235 family protein [Curtobacterium oceanosedimentum]
MAEQARRIEDTATTRPPRLVAVDPERPHEHESDGPDRRDGSIAAVGAVTDPSPPPASADPGDPAATARALGLCIAEVLTGAREVDSIARWITDDVHRHLQQRAALAARARSTARRSRGRPVLRVGSVVVCRPARGVAEATVVVHTRSHARAVAIRLEERHGRWRATAVGVL